MHIPKHGCAQVQTALAKALGLVEAEYGLVAIEDIRERTTGRRLLSFVTDVITRVCHLRKLCAHSFVYAHAHMEDE